MTGPAEPSGYERTMTVLRGARPDRVPQGEPALAPGLVRKLSDRGTAGPRGLLDASRKLGADMTGVVGGERWARASLRALAGGDLFCWAVISGPFQELMGSDPLRALGRLARPDPELGPALGRLTADAAELARDCVACGADGIIIGDDIAHKDGLLLSPTLVATAIVPLWSRIVAVLNLDLSIRGQSVPVFLHADGDISQALPLISDVGFTGVQSLEPEGGSDPVRLLQTWRGQLILYGGMSLNSLFRLESDIIASRRRLLTAGAAGGYLFSTTAGVTPSSVHLNGLLTAYGRGK